MPEDTGKATRPSQSRLPGVPYSTERDIQPQIKGKVWGFLLQRNEGLTGSRGWSLAMKVRETDSWGAAVAWKRTHFSMTGNELCDGSLDITPPWLPCLSFIHLFMCVYIFDIMKPVTLSFPYGDNGPFDRGPAIKTCQLVLSIPHWHEWRRRLLTLHSEPYTTLCLFIHLCLLSA